LSILKNPHHRELIRRRLDALEESLGKALRLQVFVRVDVQNLFFFFFAREVSPIVKKTETTVNRRMVNNRMCFIFPFAFSVRFVANILRRTKATRHDRFFSRWIGIPQFDDECVGAASSRDRNESI
jgi:hypothetical protein